MTSPRDFMLTPEQMSPFAGLLRRSAANYDAITNSQKNNQALQEAIYNNMIKKPEAENAPQITAADLLHKQNIARLVGQQADWYGPSAQATIASQNAGTNKTNQMLPGELLAQSITNKYLGQNEQANINSKNASTNRSNQMLPGDVLAQGITNKYLEPMQQAELKKNNAYANYYQNGGPRMGVGAGDERVFQNSVAQDNPQLANDPDKLREAANVLSDGGTQLSDGTPINPLSAASLRALDRVNRRGTTAALITGNVRANQAEAEIDVLDKYAQKGLKPYGDTFLNMSPKQVLDTFKTDDESQKRLGRFIASQALQNEIAQNRTKLANGQPGITNTHDLMRLSGQSINGRYPALTYKAREEASRYLNEALKEGNKVRQSVSIGASSASRPQSGTDKLANGLNKNNDPLGIR